MKRLLTSILTAGLLIAPAAYAQTTTPEAAGGTPAAAGAAEAGHSGAETGTGGTQHVAKAGGEHATPHYPLKHPAHMSWSFAGPFGKWDVGQLQRGLKVYKEVCSSCHSMKLVALRDLKALGYDDDQVKAFAADYTVKDPNPNSDGEIVERPGIPSDYFPSPFPNDEAAAAANNGAVPPDFSLLAKARAVERGFPTFVFDIATQYAEGGPDYIHALLTGYGEEPPEGVVVQPGTYYNPHFISGPALAMPPPLSADQVTYEDGAPQTVDQYSRDVSAFMMWAAEPHLVARKATGAVVMLFLVIFAGLLYMTKKRVWAGTPH